MRKFWFMMFVCLMAMVGLSSCGLNTYVVKASYDVCYPDGTKTYEQEVLVESKDYPFVSCYSYGGTNYVSAITTAFTGVYGTKEKGVTTIESTTAPIRLNSQSSIKIKGNAKEYNGKDGVY